MLSKVKYTININFTYFLLLLKCGYRKKLITYVAHICSSRISNLIAPILKISPPELLK